jgi:hypothetical protein
MDHLREELKAAFALDDEAKRDFEEWQAKHTPMVRKRAYGEGLVFKTTYTEPQPQQQTSATMDDETFVQFFEKKIAPVLGEVIAHERRAMRSYCAKEVARMLTKETAFLREFLKSELAAATASSKTGKVVLHLPRKHSDVA